MENTHPERQGWDDDRILLTEEGENYTAYCSPEADGRVFVDEEQVGRTAAKHGAPYPFDIVFHGRHPHEGEVEALSEELGERFANQFDSKVEEVYQHIEGSDDPLDVIMALEPDDLVQSPGDG